MKYSRFAILFVAAITASTAYAQIPRSQLIVVEDKGSVSAVPYYEELGLLPDPVSQNRLPSIPNQPNKPLTDADMLPVRSELLTPGIVSSRAIQAPGLMPFFLVGDDDLSKRWLSFRKEALISMNAVGFVVNVETPHTLETLRRIAPELKLVPVSGDDISERLNLQHYPALITSTSIEQ